MTVTPQLDGPRTGVSGRQVAVAFAIAALVHIALAVVIFHAPPPPGAQAFGTGGIEVSLGPAGGTQGAAPATPTAETARPVDAEDIVEPTEASLVEPVAEPPVEPPVEQPVEQVEAEPVEVESVAEPDPPAETVAAIVETAPTAVEAVAVQAVTPPPQPKPRPRTPQTATPVTAPPPAKARPAETAPVDVAKAAPAQVHAVEAAETDTAPSEVAAAPGSSDRGRSGTQNAANAGAAEARSGGGARGDSADYMARLLAWLQQHKEYPQAARRRRHEGTVMLYFSFDRTGRVHDFRLQRSSGHRTLDDEALALIQRATPLPPPPPDFGGETTEIVVPVQFALR